MKDLKLLLVLAGCLCVISEGHSYTSTEDAVAIQTPCKVSDGRDGVCIHLESEIIHCPTLRKTLLARNFTDINSAICEEPDPTTLNETKICCATNEFIELYPTVNEALHEHKNFHLIPTLNTSECGRALGSTTDRIIGGEEVPPGSHPWMVRLGMVLDDEDDIKFPCSGSIINERYILTAAHCFKQGKLRVIRLAETDEDVEEECIELGEKICQNVEDHEPDMNGIVIHRNYTGLIGSYNDIALIRLKEPIRNITSPFTRPVCLPFIHEFGLPDLENSAVSSSGAKNLLSVQGWGKANNDDNVGTKILKQVYVPLRSNIFCRHVYKHANLSITDEQICVGGTKGKGSCAGDSGSPLTLPNSEYGMRTFQIGIVSYGRRECGLENSPVVYTRVRSFLKWILDNIKE